MQPTASNGKERSDGRDPTPPERGPAPAGSSKSARGGNGAAALRARQRLGKYRVMRKISAGGFAEVYAAEDTIEGVKVALRVPRPDVVDQDLLQRFRREVRLVARLEHPNVLPVKNADVIDGLFVVATLLGKGTLHEELDRRTTVPQMMEWTRQLLSAVAHAHERGIIHCDIKPDNLIVFSDGQLRLADFGIAKAAMTSFSGSGSGTIGYLAPEQALGRPSMRSDVFAIGLVVWQMLSLEVPEWPFEWPLPGADRVSRKVGPELIDWVVRALQVDERARFRDAGHMLAAFERLRARGKLVSRRTAKRKAAKRRKTPTSADWRALRSKAFVRRFKGVLGLSHSCSRCEGPMSEEMRACPWCGHAPKRYTGKTRMPARCGRCGRGRKLDWRFCAWCYGAGFKTVSERTYSDKRYAGKCSNPRCTRKDLMPFMRYCPWCRTKVRKRWTFPGADGRCRACGSGLAKDFWKWCPWCTTRIRKGP